MMRLWESERLYARLLEYPADDEALKNCLQDWVPGPVKSILHANDACRIWAFKNGFVKFPLSEDSAFISTVLICKKDSDEVVGFSRGQARGLSWEAERVSFAPAVRGQHYYREFMRANFRFLLAQGMQDVYFEVFKNSDSALPMRNKIENDFSLVPDRVRQGSADKLDCYTLSREQIELLFSERPESLSAHLKIDGVNND